MDSKYTNELKEAAQQKVFAAEKYVSYIRAFLVLFNSITFYLFYLPTASYPVLGNMIIVVANIYSVYVLLVKPYRKYPVFLSSYFTSITDGLLITLWLIATGGITSEYHYIWYISLMAIGFRFGTKEVVSTGIFYSVLYIGVVLFVNGFNTDIISVITLRTGYLAMVGWFIIYVTRETLEQTTQKLIMKKLAEEANSARDALSKSEKEYKMLVENAPNFIIKISRDYNITFINKVQPGYRIEDVVGASAFSFLYTEDEKKRIERIYDEIFKTGKGQTIEVLGFGGNGEMAYYQSSIVPLEDRDELIIISAEITKIKEAQQLAEHSLKIKSEFLANMSHEIRTPMNGVLGFTKLLKQTDLSSEQLNYIETIDSSGNHLLHIINDILDISQIESGKLQLSFTKFNIRKLIKNTVNISSIKAEEKGLKLSVEVNESIPEILVGDEVRLQQILLNIIYNGLKFTEQGEVKITVIKGGKKGDKTNINFTISDTGVGIPEELQDIIFDSFTQLKSDQKRLTGGTGLGLSITKKLVDLYGGKIEINSKLDIGSEFKIEIPFQFVKESTATSKSNSEGGEEFKSLMNKRVLIVEDNEVNMKLTNAIIQKWGCVTSKAENGKIAVEQIRNNEFDVVLMDIQMPVMDGYEATNIIRNELLNDAIPILALTAYAQDQELKKCTDLGMNDTLTKPINPKLLYQKMVELVMG